jgi:hypothetical protein
VHRLFGFWISCLIGSLGFTIEIIFETDILPMFNDTNSLIRDKRAPLRGADAKIEPF